MSNRMWRVAIGVFVVGLVFDFLIYRILLGGSLASDVALRPLEEGPWPKLVIGELIFAIALAWIYQIGLSSAPALGQGLRFGLAMAFLFAAGGGLQLAPLVPASEFIIIGGIVANAIKVLGQGVTASLLA
ncbi:MAG: hypothetical protein ACT443_12265 [Gemmatimonadota bacterium]